MQQIIIWLSCWYAVIDELSEAQIVLKGNAQTTDYNH